MGPREWSLAVLEGSGAYIKLAFQCSLLLLLLLFYFFWSILLFSISFLPMLLFYSISTFDFIFAFYFQIFIFHVSYVSVGHCAWKLQIQLTLFKNKIKKI